MTVYSVTSDRMLLATVLSTARSTARKTHFFAEFDETWDAYPDKWAIFSRADVPIDTVRTPLSACGDCIIPDALLDSDGLLSVTLYGKNATEEKDSFPVTLRVQAGTPCAVLSNVTPSISSHISSLQAVLTERMQGYAKPYISFLPLSDYYVSDTEQRLYFNEIALYDNGLGYFKVSADGVTYPEITVGDNGVSGYVSFCVTSKTEFPLTIRYLCRGELIASHTLTVHVSPTALPKKKYLFLGDSLTDAGHIQNQFKALNGDNVILYGTRGTGELLHEGRGSWSVTHYFMEKKGETLNPFYNPETQTFDFSYYMANHPAFADVEIVNIFLGRNNGFNLAIMERSDEMVSSVKRFNSAITVTLMGAYNVACDESGTGRYLQSAKEFNFAAHRYNKAFYARYADSKEVFLIPAHCNLDNKYDYTAVEEQISLFDERTATVYNNNVHPDVRGYKKLGVAVSAFFRYLLNR